jgi:hypothetical protein
MTQEVCRLTLEGPDATDLKEKLEHGIPGPSEDAHPDMKSGWQTYPAKELIVLARPIGIPQPALRIILLNEIFQDVAGLPNVNLLAITESVGDGRNLAIGVDF